MATIISSFITFTISIVMAFFWLKSLSENKEVTVTFSFCYLLLGASILVLPLAYTTNLHFSNAVLRIVGMVAGIIFLFTCLQARYCRQAFLWLIYGLLAIVVLQAIVAYQQVFIPDNAWVPFYGQRVYGTFFQPNLLASFIATGLVLTLMLILLPGLALTEKVPERCRQYSLIVLLVALSTLLVWIQSRAGWIGGITATLLLLLRFGRLNMTRTLMATGALAVGVFLGMRGLLCSPPSHLIQVAHESSNHARWTMLRDTLAMVVKKPLLGWGYGGFEYDFQHFRVNQVPPTIVTEVARHPHNEILMWIVEGGVVSLLGIILILVSVILVIRQAIHYDRSAFLAGHRMAGVPTALCLALLPVAIHTQLEFPFYISTLHFAVFLLLFAMADRISGNATSNHVLPAVIGVVTTKVMLALALVLTLMASFSLNGNLVLAQTERFGMEDVTRLKEMPAISQFLHQDRVAFDEQVNVLLTYNRSRDERLLEQYRQWAQSYLQRRVDKNVYASLIKILRHQQKFNMAELYRKDAALLFPTDRQFLPTENEAIYGGYPSEAGLKNPSHLTSVP